MTFRCFLLLGIAICELEGLEVVDGPAALRPGAQEPKP